MLAIIDVVFWASIKILGVLGALVGILIFVIIMFYVLKIILGW